MAIDMQALRNIFLKNRTAKKSKWEEPKRLPKGLSEPTNPMFTFLRKNF